MDPEIDRLRRMLVDIETKQRWHEQLLRNIEALLIDIQRGVKQAR